MSTDSDAAPREQDTAREIERFYAESAEMRRELDKSILTLSAGALGISLTFLKDIAGVAPTASWVLGMAWLALVTAIGATLLSRRASESAWQKAAAERSEDNSPRNPTWRAAVRALNAARNRVIGCNTVALVSFLLGVVLLLGFALTNV
mgnify:CR=1 FL=1